MLFSAYLNSSIRWTELLPLAYHIEETGWDGIWVSDHFMPNEENPVDDWQEAWTTLAALSATIKKQTADKKIQRRDARIN